MTDNTKREHMTSRSEFETTINTLVEMIKNRQISITDPLSVDSLVKIKIAPNGRIVMNSVDASARSFATAAAQIKKISF